MHDFISKLNNQRIRDIKNSKRIPKDRHQQLIDLTRKKFVCLVCKETRTFDEKDYKIIRQEFSVFKKEHIECGSKEIIVTRNDLHSFQKDMNIDDMGLYSFKLSKYLIDKADYIIFEDGKETKVLKDKDSKSKK